MTSEEILRWARGHGEAAQTQMVNSRFEYLRGSKMGPSCQGIDTDTPHMTNIVGFYAREDGKLFVEPIETSEVVHLKQWRCLLKHNFEAVLCAND